MNYLDIILLIIILLGVFRGFKNGFLLELASLLGLVVGIYGAIHFSHHAVKILSRWVDWDDNLISIVAFAATFIVILLVVSLLARVLTQVINLVMLGLVNKLLGALFGLLKSVFIISLFLMFITAYKGSVLLDENTLEESQIYPIVVPVAPALMPNILRELENYEEYL